MSGHFVVERPSSFVIEEYIPINKAGGPYIGPRGGKWANPERTISWKDPAKKKVKAKRKKAKPKKKQQIKHIVTADLQAPGPAHEGQVSNPSKLGDYTPPGKEVPKDQRMSPYIHIRKRRYLHHGEFGNVFSPQAATAAANREGAKVLRIKDYVGLEKPERMREQMSPAMRHFVMQMERRAGGPVDPQTVAPKKHPKKVIDKLLTKEARARARADAEPLTARERDILLEHRLHEMRHQVVQERNAEKVKKALKWSARDVSQGGPEYWRTKPQHEADTKHGKYYIHQPSSPDGRNSSYSVGYYGHYPSIRKKNWHDVPSLGEAKRIAADHHREQAMKKSLLFVITE